MNNVSIANQTISITKQKQYTVSGNTIHLPEVNYEHVIAYSPEDGAELLRWDLTETLQNRMSFWCCDVCRKS